MDPVMAASLGDAQPWQHFSSPIDQWAVLPSFVVGEVLFIIGAALAFWHASRRGRDHQLIWLAALVAGTANDFIFMALPLVDNFWQGQGTIMLTSRMPLYIPCVYVCFMYYPTVAVRRLGLSRWSGAALSGLAAGLFYAPYDIVGAKFLWWTWHDTDQSIAKRILGAPCSSTLWVLTFVATFAWLIDHTLRDRIEVSGSVFAKGLAKVAGLTTVVMVLQITVLQQIDGGTPGYGALAACAVAYAVLVFLGRNSAQPTRLERPDRVALGYIGVYFSTLVLIGMLFNPTSHVSTGIHQPTGECYVEAKDITGITRYKYLCVTDYDEDFTFECVDGPPRTDSTWYTVCGRAHRNPGVWKAGLGGLGLLSAGLFMFLALAARQKH